MKVKLDLPYPEVKVEEKNPYYADLLSEDYAGKVSETTAALLYSYQHFITFDNNVEFSKIIEEISIVEMTHLEMLGKTIKLLGSEPIYKTCEASRGDCVMWNASNIDYSSKLREMLEIDIKAETNAIKTYESHRKIIKDKYIKNMLDRIILDEKRHLEIFNNLYDGLRQKQESR